MFYSNKMQLDLVRACHIVIYCEEQNQKLKAACDTCDSCNYSHEYHVVFLFLSTFPLHFLS